MNLKHRMFAEEYLSSFNAVESYMVVYPDTKSESASANAYRLLKDPEIQQYLETRFEGLLVSTEELMAILSNLVRNAKSETAQLKAIELLGRTKALFIDRQDITSKGERLTLSEYMKNVDSKGL